MSGTHERMFPKERLEEKLNEARGVLARCIGEKGVWASSSRYRDMCWTRDFALSVPALVREGHAALVRRHLEELMRRQRDDGKIPILFLDNIPRWLLRKAWNAISKRRISFSLLRFFSKDGIVDISPLTKDSELMFIIALYEYIRATGDIAFRDASLGNIDLAFRYIETRLLKYGLLMGADWRDTRPELGRETLLGLNCLLYWAYLFRGWVEKANTFGTRINGWFWIDSYGYYRDHTNTLELDLFGNALAIRCDIFSKDRNKKDSQERATRIVGNLYSRSSSRGCVERDVPLPPIDSWEKEIMARVGKSGLVFPFLVSQVILAAHSVGAAKIARREFEKLLSLEGNYEWYDPATGRGGGSPDQLWTAALFLDAAHALQDELRYPTACF